MVRRPVITLAVSLKRQGGRLSHQVRLIPYGLSFLNF